MIAVKATRVVLTLCMDVLLTDDSGVPEMVDFLASNIEAKHRSKSSLEELGFQVQSVMSSFLEVES